MGDNPNDANRSSGMSSTGRQVLNLVVASVALERADRAVTASTLPKIDCGVLPTDTSADKEGLTFFEREPYFRERPMNYVCSAECANSGAQNMSVIGKDFMNLDANDLIYGHTFLVRDPLRHEVSSESATDFGHRARTAIAWPLRVSWIAQALRKTLHQLTRVNLESG